MKIHTSYNRLRYLNLKVYRSGAYLEELICEQKVERSKVSTLVAACWCVTQYFTFLQSEGDIVWARDYRAQQ